MHQGLELPPLWRNSGWTVFEAVMPFPYKQEICCLLDVSFDDPRLIFDVFILRYIPLYQIHSQLQPEKIICMLLHVSRLCPRLNPAA